MGRSMSTTQHFANWICGDKLSNKYLLYSFMAAQGYLTTSGQGTTVKTIYMPALKELHLLLPNMDEQLDIVRRVEELLNSADAIEKQFRAAKVRLDKLTQSILAKAFRGELLTSSVDSDIEAIENSVEALNA
jgi:type I restriction enzyme S subunit